MACAWRGAVSGQSPLPQSLSLSGGGGGSFSLLCSSSSCRAALLRQLTTPGERQGAARAQGKVGHSGYAPEFVLGEDVVYQLHSLCTTAGIP